MIPDLSSAFDPDDDDPVFDTEDGLDEDELQFEETLDDDGCQDLEAFADDDRFAEESEFDDLFLNYCGDLARPCDVNCGDSG